jgi:hypothetical protein
MSYNPVIDRVIRVEKPVTTTLTKDPYYQRNAVDYRKQLSRLPEYVGA